MLSKTILSQEPAPGGAPWPSPSSLRRMARKIGAVSGVCARCVHESTHACESEAFRRLFHLLAVPLLFPLGVCWMCLLPLSRCSWNDVLCISSFHSRRSVSVAPSCLSAARSQPVPAGSDGIQEAQTAWKIQRPGEAAARR